MRVVIKLSADHLSVPLPVVLCIRRTMYTDYALSASDKFFESGLLLIRKDVACGTHHDDDIIVGQPFLGKYGRILRDVHLKPVLRSQFFDGCYSFRNRLVPESLRFAKYQCFELLSETFSSGQQKDCGKQQDIKCRKDFLIWVHIFFKG